MDDAELSLLPSRVDLPRGRAALTDAEVTESRRGRILQAVIEDVAERGYHQSTIATIIARAKVSRSSFYDAFTDKQDAFANAYIAVSQRALDQMWSEPHTAATSLEAGARAAIAGYVRRLESNPAVAKCFMVDIRAAGDEVMSCRDEFIDRHMGNLRAVIVRLHGEGVVERIPSMEELRGYSGAFDELAAREIRRQWGSGELDLDAIVEPSMQVLRALVTDPS